VYELTYLFDNYGNLLIVLFQIGNMPIMLRVVKICVLSFLLGS